MNGECSPDPSGLPVCLRRKTACPEPVEGVSLRYDLFPSPADGKGAAGWSKGVFRALLVLAGWPIRTQILLGTLACCGSLDKDDPASADVTVPEFLE